MNTPQQYINNQEENERLRLENAQLKKDLEKEEFLHKTLYKQWNELNARMSGKEREFNRFKSGNLFYKYAFYSILFLAVPVYYFLGNGKSSKNIEPVSQVTSPPAVVATNQTLSTNTNQTLNTNTDTIHTTTVKTDDMKFDNVKPQEKKVIQPDTSQSKPAAVIKAPIEKPLSDSVRNLIYSEGWDAYYEKLTSRYSKSSQKYQIWLAGWKDAENDANKLLTKSFSDTLSRLSGNNRSQ
jgi:hypothetical protein